jgi:glucokinase
MLMTAYGAEAGNAALKFLPLGGMYIAGGLAPKNKEAIIRSVERAQLYADQASLPSASLAEGAEEEAGGTWPGFMPAFVDKGRQRDLVSRIPVKLVLNEDIGQQGAQYTAYTQLVVASGAPVAVSDSGSGGSSASKIGAGTVVGAVAGAVVGAIATKVIAKL